MSSERKQSDSYFLFVIYNTHRLRVELDEQMLMKIIEF